MDGQTDGRMHARTPSECSGSSCRARADACRCSVRAPSRPCDAAAERDSAPRAARRRSPRRAASSSTPRRSTARCDNSVTAHATPTTIARRPSSATEGAMPMLVGARGVAASLAIAPRSRRRRSWRCPSRIRGRTQTLTTDTPHLLRRLIRAAVGSCLLFGLLCGGCLYALTLRSSEHAAIGSELPPTKALLALFSNPTLPTQACALPVCGRPPFPYFTPAGWPRAHSCAAMLTHSTATPQLRSHLTPSGARARAAPALVWAGHQAPAPLDGHSRDRHRARCDVAGIARPAGGHATAHTQQPIECGVGD